MKHEQQIIELNSRPDESVWTWKNVPSVPHEKDSWKNAVQSRWKWPKHEALLKKKRKPRKTQWHSPLRSESRCGRRLMSRRISTGTSLSSAAASETGMASDSIEAVAKAATLSRRATKFDAATTMPPTEMVAETSVGSSESSQRYDDELGTVGYRFEPDPTVRATTITTTTHTRNDGGDEIGRVSQLERPAEGQESSQPAATTSDRRGLAAGGAGAQAEGGGQALGADTPLEPRAQPPTSSSHQPNH